MKSSIAFLLATVVLAVQGSTLHARRPNNGGQANRNNGAKHKGSSANNNGGASTTAANNNGGVSTAVANTTSSNNNGGGNPQTSLTLDPSVICTACTNNGQNPPVAGQSASLTSPNNFINFCLNKALTNGQQVVTGSCNGVGYGDLPPSTNQPAAKISFPPNGGTFPANEAFNVNINIQGMVTGNFVNAQSNYFGAPQQLQGGLIVGHSHITVQSLPAIDTTTPADPLVFAFFKGINAPAVNGVLTANVTAGLPAGVYRFCTMNTSANHTPALGPVAQHGHFDDCIYATAVTGSGSGSNTTTANNGGNSNSTVSNASSTDSAGASSAASSTTAAAAASSSASKGSGRNRGKGGQGRGRGGRGRHPY